MSDDRQCIRFKFSAEDWAQWTNDISAIRRVLGQVPYKYLILAAVHQWANRIRAGKEIDK